MRQGADRHCGAGGTIGRIEELGVDGVVSGEVLHIDEEDRHVDEDRRARHPL